MEIIILILLIPALLVGLMFFMAVGYTILSGITWILFGRTLLNASSVNQNRIDNRGLKKGSGRDRELTLYKEDTFNTSSCSIDEFPSRQNSETLH
tara:strand:- start:785 stop:1069 length:285 start_codon:yes stop_codon:yes gene_type:complete